MTALTDAGFYLPNTTTSTLTNGTGSATFTRATTKNVFNASGVLEEAASGNIAFNSDYGAHIDPASKTNTLLFCRDMRKSYSGGGWIIPGAIGSELIVNGHFTTDTSGWAAAGATIAQVSGELELSLTSSLGYASQVIAVTSGKTYTLTGTYRLAGSGGTNVVMSVGGGADVNGIYTTSTSNITSTVHFTSAGGSVTLSLLAYGSTSTKAYFDSISLKEADIQVALTSTGIDGVANSCSRLTCKAAGATISQTITAAAAAACSGAWVKRVTGTGTVEFTRDNGSTWLDITSELSTGAFYVAKIQNTSVTNPVISFRMGTVDDVIDVDAVLNHLGTLLCEPIFTTAAAVTRNAEVLTYQTASNFSDTAGTILATFTPTYDTWPAGSIVGKESFGLLASSTNSGVQGADGTNTVSGATGTPSGSKQIGIRWDGSSLQAFSTDGVTLDLGAAGSYDGSFNLSTIAINPGCAGYIKDVAIFDSSLSDNQLKSIYGIPTASAGIKSIYPYNMLVANQDEITLEHLTSCMGVNDGTWKDPAAGWLTSFANYAYITTGRRLHGDNQPTAWVNSLTNRGTDPDITQITQPLADPAAWYNPMLTNYWNRINCWATVVQEASNTCTNAYTAVYDIQLYVLSASAGKWIRVNSAHNGRPAFPLLWYPKNVFNSQIDGVNSYDDYGNAGWTNFYLGTEKNLHNALMSTQVIDASDVSGAMATCKARLFNPTGAAFDATPKIMVEMGMDNKYNTDALNTGTLAGVGYLPGMAGSASKLLPADGTPIRVTVSTMRTTGTAVGDAFNSVWTDTLTNIPYLTEAEMAANLPVLTLSTPT